MRRRRERLDHGLPKGLAAARGAVSGGCGAVGRMPQHPSKEPTSVFSSTAANGFIGALYEMM